MGDITMEAIKEHAAQLIDGLAGINENVGLFTIKTGNGWIESAKARPIPEMLFGEFWFEGELCILFADTNLGKSILAVQIADSISRGEAIPGFKMQAPPQPVLIFDFEMGDKQFEVRYSDGYQNHYQFDPNFYRAEVNPDSDLPECISFEEHLHRSIEAAIIETGARALIVDNITYLKNETERAKDALPLMKHLKLLKSKHHLSILALAHTPKRDLTKPITRNDLQGSKMLINFADAAFAIGESYQDNRLRYIKQIKARNTEILYHGDNVITIELDKPTNFLGFQFVGFSTELEHLRRVTDEDKSAMKARVNELKQQGKSYRDIGIELGISHMKAKRYHESQ